MRYEGVRQQSRVHPAVFGEANARFFGGKIVFGGNFNFDLHAAYEAAIREMRMPGSYLSEHDKRCVYIEIIGHLHARASRDTGSRANIKYLNYVMSLVEGTLQRIWGGDMSEKVAIITPYLRQKQLYEVRLQELRDKGWSPSALPQVFTVDEVIDRDFEHVILDVVDCLATADGMGYWAEEKSNHSVFFTRSRKAQWIIGGQLADPGDYSVPLPTFKYDSAGEQIFRKWERPWGKKYRTRNIRPHTWASAVATSGSRMDGSAESPYGVEVGILDWALDFWSDAQLKGCEALIKDLNASLEGAQVPPGDLVHLNGSSRDYIKGYAAAS